MRVLSEATERVGKLRERTVQRIHDWEVSPEAELEAGRSWWRSSGESSHMLRRGRLAGDILSGLTPVIGDGELLVGRPCTRPLAEPEQAELERWRSYGAPATSRADGQRAHMAIDYELLLRQGVGGVKRQIGVYRGKLDVTIASDLEKDLFYQGCLAALDGMVKLAHKYADYAEARATDAAGCADTVRQQELLEIARVCRRVPEHPAASFREAIQSVHFATWCMCAGNQMLLFQLGRPDRYLLPYYRRDIAEGCLSSEEAQELIDCLCLLLNDYTPRGLAVGLMVGGRDSSGCDVTNDLTYMFINSVGHTRLAYPGIGLCWNADTPPDTLTLSAGLLAKGLTHPAIFNDDVITAGLMRWGLPYRDACLYIHSTCVEITPVAISNAYVASPYHNLVQYLHDCLGVNSLGRPNAADPPAIASFDDLMAQFARRLSEGVARGVVNENKAMMSRATAGGFPLLSCFVGDCLSRGRDIDQGGARVNWIEPSFVGLANLVDSLAAIRQLVFEDGTLSLTDLRAALVANFEGHDHTRAMIAHVPKYGNDNDRVDSLATEVTEFILRACEKYKTYWGDSIVPGFFCWQMHTELGRTTCASPDGRAAGFPFADGSGPAQGRERFGPTALVLSSTKWDHAPMVGGIAVNMRFAPGGDPGPLVEPMAAVLRTYLELGGMEVQVNVVDAATLKDAQLNPASHGDLVVRVAGYSDYFVSLSPAMQAEVTARSEMELK